jgi:ABC-type branched-subunit amino acid transport system permease subunit
MDIGEIFATVIGVILMVYAAFIIISQLSQQTPEFAYYGWLMFGALIIGVVAFFKYGLFNK